MSNQCLIRRASQDLSHRNELEIRDFHGTLYRYDENSSLLVIGATIKRMQWSMVLMHLDMMEGWYVGLRSRVQHAVFNLIGN